MSFHKHGKKQNWPLFIKMGTPLLVYINQYPCYIPLPGKLMGSLEHQRLSQFAEKYAILDDSQGGFRRGHSTVDTVSKFTHDIFEGLFF